MIRRMEYKRRMLFYVERSNKSECRVGGRDKEGMGRAEQRAQCYAGGKGKDMKCGESVLRGDGWRKGEAELTDQEVDRGYIG